MSDKPCVITRIQAALAFWRKIVKNSQGFSMVETLTVLGLIGILAAIVIPQLTSIATSPTQNAVTEVAGNFKLIRAKAMATTSAYKLTATSTTYLSASTAYNCTSTTWTPSPEFDLNLNQSGTQGVQILPTTTLVTATPTTTTSATGWSICFNSQGWADSNLTLNLQDTKNSSSTMKNGTISVLIGGAVQAKINGVVVQ